MKLLRLVLFSLAVTSVPAALAQERKAPPAGVPTAAPRGPQAAQKQAGGAARPAAPDVAVTLAASRGLFARSDLDRNGRLSSQEAAAAGLGPREVSGNDRNGDAQLDPDEFTAAHYAALVRLKRPVAQDLAAGAAGITAATAKRGAGTRAKPAPNALGQARAAAPADSKGELERIVAEALSRAQAQAPRPRRAESGQVVGAGVPRAEREERARLAQEELERRIEASKLTDAQAASEREKLRQRVEARAEAPAAAAAAGSNQPNPPPAPILPPQFRERVEQARAEAGERLASTGATPEQVEAALQRIDQRADVIARREAKRAARAQAAAEASAAAGASPSGSTPVSPDERANAARPAAPSPAKPAGAGAAKPDAPAQRGGAAQPAPARPVAPAAGAKLAEIDPAKPSDVAPDRGRGGAARRRGAGGGKGRAAQGRATPAAPAAMPPEGAPKPAAAPGATPESAPPPGAGAAPQRPGGAQDTSSPPTPSGSKPVDAH